MAASEDLPAAIYAHDLVALSDIELDQYLEKSRLENGITTVDLEDPENLPESFIQRLR